MLTTSIRGVCDAFTVRRHRRDIDSNWGGRISTEAWKWTVIRKQIYSTTGQPWPAIHRITTNLFVSAFRQKMARLR